MKTSKFYRAFSILPFYFLFIFCSLFFSCKSVSNLNPIPNFSIDYDKNEIDKTVFLLGDAGNSDSLTPIFLALKNELAQNPSSTLIFLEIIFIPMD